MRCFTSPGSLRVPYVFRHRWHGMTRTRLSHSEIRGSKLAWQLPAAYRSLQRPSSASSAKASTGCPLQLAETMLALAMEFTRTSVPVVRRLPERAGPPEWTALLVGWFTTAGENASASLKAAQCV